MLEKDHFDDITVKRDGLFHPVTKAPLPTVIDRQCFPDVKHETGIIICNKKKASRSTGAAVTTSIFLMIIAVILFSVKVEVKPGSIDPLLAILVFVPQLVGIVLVLIAITTLARASISR
jgi:hypothetical protein